MQSLLWLVLAFTLLPSWAYAQFGFFDNMFQGQQGHGHHQQQQQHRAGSNQWAMQAESVSCNKYLCPGTLTCVDAPVNCPCPYPEDIKCVIPDMDRKGQVHNGAATVICVSGKEGCDLVHKLT
ncbi:hypothetical protein M408DRAFT_113369 [Serendipita vermifera MAFF 305830]|uniref:Long chronological lifespan protein 2 n=1 Tax=Serendipita vermifera MAFF 305830 TaxID=933852 RepID=A0A0C2XK53_SERVB|nr:hypothetical protein M408DRAFT_113369 [Serendipita vermifera MAFF 305830]